LSARAPGGPDFQDGPRDFAYMLWVKQQRCLLETVYDAGPCLGVIQAAHLGGRPGTAMKGPDRSCGPLCLGHHQDHDQTRGWFRPLDPGEQPSARPATDEQRDRWRMQSIMQTQRMRRAYETCDF
jgi:hypothetical protein